MALKYVGTDPLHDWLPGVPARDLTDEEEQDYPEAAASRLYEKTTAKSKSADKE